MSNWELKIGSEQPKRNAINGRFMKGWIPFNKGKKWDEYLSKRKQKKFLKNLRKGRKDSWRTPDSGTPKQKVVAVNDHGKYLVIESISEASRFANVSFQTIRTCCKLNRERKVLKNRGGKVNTDHKCKGVRFYFEDDPIWLEKIKK